jgi:dethiobiotin synthetase
MTSGYFVTGTDTGIGKTIVSTLLAIGLEGQYWKPVQTGSGESSDSDFARQWLPAECVAKEAYSFAPPVSPHLAASRVGQRIELSSILRARPEGARPLIVEGAGGLLVPLNPDCLMVDLIRALELPVILASSTRLGTINHSLLTLAELRRQELRVAGVIMVGPSEGEVCQAIESFGQTAILGEVPWVDQFSYAWFKNVFNQLTLVNEGASHG